MTLTLPKPRPDDPLVIRVLADYRAQMDGQEAALMENMARRWLLIEGGLDADIAALAQEMARRTAAGEVITQQMVWRAERYQIIKARLADEIKKYNQDAVGIISSAQRQYATLGINAAQDAITAMYPSPLSAAFNRINVGAVESMIGFAGDGSPLRTLLAKDYGEATDGLLNALINGLGRGLGPGQIGRDMADGMGMGLDRALLIARTEAARAQRTASTQQYRDSGITTGFMRLVKKSTACFGCLMLDGEIFELEEELSDHPRGKCMTLALIEGMPPPTWQKGQDWFLEQDEDAQKRILGPEKYQLWKDGQIKLTDLARKTHSDVWGDSPRVATLAELKGGVPVKIGFGETTGGAAGQAFGDRITIDREQYGRMTDAGKENLLSHELAHNIIEDKILSNNDEWNRASTALLVKETATGKQLFILGETRIGEAMVSTVAAYATNAKNPMIGLAYPTWTPGQWRAAMDWAKHALNYAGTNKHEFNSIVAGLMRKLGK